MSQGLDKCKRIVWRLREKFPESPHLFKEDDLKRAIMLEVGIDARTCRKYKAALKKLGWIKGIYGTARYKLTGDDIVDSF